MPIRHFMLGIAAFSVTGCATVINGTSQDVTVRSDPSGATVKITNGTECVTPCELNLKRRHDLRVDFTRDGYKPIYVLVQSRTGGAVAGNLLLGGLIGGVVDSSNGATNTLYPAPVSVKLAAVDSSDEAMLLDKKGKTIGTVATHNAAVSKDVAKTIGAEAAGLADTSAPEPTTAGGASAEPTASDTTEGPVPSSAADPAPASVSQGN